jgi:hypothetical protein
MSGSWLSPLEWSRWAQGEKVLRIAAQVHGQANAPVKGNGNLNGNGKAKGK